MPGPELIRRFVLPLEPLGLRYMVTGSVAAMSYGEPRLTNDVDIVLDLPAQRIADFVTTFQAPDLYVPPVETIRNAVNAPRGSFNLILVTEALKADFFVGLDGLSRWGLQRRHAEAIGEESIWIAPAEYVIVRKLEYFRLGGSAKHLSDIRSMLRFAADRIQLGVVDRLAAEHGLEEIWVRVRGDVPGF
ncbi:MAG: hypothetical protein HY700_02185 [Gemmatimonadetes bacterium]|nr:hypothetical protein [Gemmatimonadota bacterium]